MTASPASTSSAVLPDPVAGELEWCLLRDAAPPPDTRPRTRAADAVGASGDRTADQREPGTGRVGARHGETLSDIDLLVHPAHLPAMVARLAAAGFVERPAWGRGSHRFFFRYDPAAGGWLKLDVVSEVAFGPAQELATRLAPAVLARCDGRAPAEQDEFWILLLHCLLDRGGVCGRHTERLVALLPHAIDGAGLNKARPDAAGPGAYPLVASLLGADGTRQLLADVAAGGGDLSGHARSLRRRWGRRHRVTVTARRVRALATRAATKLLTARRRRGVAVAVVGPDGAGKSSVVTALTRTYPFPVLSYYAGQYALDARPARLARLPGGHTMGLLGRQARVSLVALGHALRGRVVVFDRYAYDSLLARPGASLKTRARRALLGRVALRPRLVVVLDAPGEVLHARSGEHSAQALEEQRGRYAALARSQPGWVVVDATGTADDVRRAVTAQLWACHSGVWRPPRTARATPRATARPGGRRGPAGAG